ADLAFLVNRIADLRLVCKFALPFLPQLVNVVQRWLTTGSLTEELRTGLVRLGKAIERFLDRVDRATERRLCGQLVALAGRPVPGATENSEAEAERGAAPDRGGTRRKQGSESPRRRGR